MEVDLASHRARERVPRAGLGMSIENLHRILLVPSGVGPRLVRRGGENGGRFLDGERCGRGDVRVAAVAGFRIGPGSVEAPRRRRVVRAGGRQHLADRGYELRLLRRPLEPIRPRPRGVQDLLELYDRELLGIRGGRRPRGERAPSDGPRARRRFGKGGPTPDSTRAASPQPTRRLRPARRRQSSPNEQCRDAHPRRL